MPQAARSRSRVPSAQHLPWSPLHLLPETDPRFFCSVHHNLTLTLWEFGDYHAAAEAMESSRELYQACPDAHTQARLAWVQRLAEEMHAIFESQEIHREALAALLLFQEAAREERLTVERVEGLIRYLKKARTNPGLRFGR